MFSSSLLPEFDAEMANTRKMLARVPDAQLAWTPHHKSMSLRQLTSHLSEMPVWAIETLAKDDFDISPVDGPPFTPYEMTSVAEALSRFDDHLRQARALLATATDETMMRPWSFKRAGVTLFSMPKAALMRTHVMNHMIHHRGQLGVYLRLNDVPVPGLYGPSADEQ
jgi:uncharacterized damage-inducible protein DinB